jgi:heme/copper-type cytochrome/quinol oxidase subunit 4
MKKSLKTYAIGMALIVLTILTFGFILPAGISADNDLAIVFTFLFIIVVYLPLAANMLEYLGKILLKSFENDNMD